MSRPNIASGAHKTKNGFYFQIFIRHFHKNPLVNTVLAAPSLAVAACIAIPGLIGSYGSAA